MKKQQTPHLILASSSIFRARLLQTIAQKVHQINPEIDETPYQDELPTDLVKRLARDKAYAVAQSIKLEEYKKPTLVIASDQIALHNNEILGKPFTYPKAIEQLTRFSGQKVSFMTSLYMLNLHTDQHQSVISNDNVYFRELTYEEIKAYVKREEPLYCAGSFKSEGLGIMLFNKIESEDLNSLIGLPLIQLNQCLLAQGINLLTYNVQETMYHS